MRELEQMRAALMRMNVKMVAEEIGVHRQTLYRFVQGTHTPSYDTLKKLDVWLTKLGSGEL